MKAPPTQKLKHESHFWPSLMLLSLVYAGFMAIPTPDGHQTEIENHGILIGLGLLSALFCFGMFIYSPSVKISPTQFQYRFPFKSFSYNWIDVSEFHTVKLTKGAPIVSFTVESNPEEITKTFDANFGYDAVDLAKLFNAYRAYGFFVEENKNYAIFASQDISE